MCPFTFLNKLEVTPVRPSFLQNNDQQLPAYFQYRYRCAPWIRSQLHTRITSYNVCYTKLLRVAERFGGQVLDTMAIENFISVKETEGPKLAMALEEHVKEYGVDIMNLQRAAGVERKGDFVEVKLESGAVLKSKSVILSTGARWREMNVPGEKDYRNKGVAYCPHCDGPLFKGKRVAVIGGGNSGVEAAIDLAGVVAHVTLIEFDSQLRADAVLQSKLRSLPNVNIITSALTTEVLGDGNKVNALTYKDRQTDEIKKIDLEGIFVQIGLLPNTDFLKGSQVELSGRNEIRNNFV